MLYAILSSIAMLIISITMLARCNDLGWRPGITWHVRRVGFVLAGVAPWALVWFDLNTDGAFLTVYEVIFRLGVALVFLTTPYLPPWHTYVFGDADADETIMGDDRRG